MPKTLFHTSVHLFHLFVLGAQLFWANWAQTISTVAGIGVGGYSGNGGPATDAMLNYPLGVTVDNTGNIFISDSGNDFVRAVDSHGKIQNIAGTGSSNWNGYSGPALAINFHPSGIFLNPYGNLFIMDLSYCIIRKLSGNYLLDLVGDGYCTFSGDGGEATSASLNNPLSLFVDPSGDIYIADYGNNRIRHVNSLGTIVTVAGNGNYQYSGDDIPATNAQFDPAGVFVDSTGNIFIADKHNNRIRKVDTLRVIHTVAGNGIGGFSGDGGSATSAKLNGPSAVFVDAMGNIFIADTGNHRIRKVSNDGVISTVAGDGIAGFSGDGGPPSGASLNFPSGLFVDPSGNIFIADTSNHRIRKVTSPPAPNPTPFFTPVVIAGLVCVSVFVLLSAMWIVVWIRRRNQRNELESSEKSPLVNPHVIGAVN